MPTLVVSAQLTLDGVMDSIEHWFDPDEHSESYGFAQLVAADALLLGRKTFQNLRGHWAHLPDDGRWASRINSIPKYVVSTTLTEPLDWNATLLRGDLDAAVTELKTGASLLSFGFGALAHRLARAGLADEFRFWVHPAVWGGDGERPFAGLGLVRLEFVSATTFASGITMLCYRPTSVGAPDAGG